MIDRKRFFDSVRASPFNGNLTQDQVNGMNYLLDVWESVFTENDIRMLAYALATVFHETAQTMRPIGEYGAGAGMPYGAPTGPYNQCYYGRGHVQLTWLENYERGEAVLRDKYGIHSPMVKYPHRMLEDETSALILFDGMMDGWFTGAKLGDFFNATTEDPYNARKVVNGLDQAETIAGYYTSFKAGLPSASAPTAT